MAGVVPRLAPHAVVAPLGQLGHVCALGQTVWCLLCRPVGCGEAPLPPRASGAGRVPTHLGARALSHNCRAAASECDDGG